MDILKFNEYIKESDSFDDDNHFVKLLKNKLTYQYKVRKNKYIKVKDISGDITDSSYNININFSNKDVIESKYQNGELSIKINGELIYDLDEIDYNDTLNLIYKTYEKYLKQQNLNIIKKENPFKNED